MLVFEETGISGMGIRGMLSVRLTTDELRIDIIFLPWTLVQVPLAQITSVMINTSRLNPEVTFAYINHDDSFRTFSFASYTPLRWRDACQQVGLRLREPDVV